MKPTTEKIMAVLHRTKERIAAAAQYVRDWHPAYVLCGVTMAASILVGICIRRIADVLSGR